MNPLTSRADVRPRPGVGSRRFWTPCPDTLRRRSRRQQALLVELLLASERGGVEDVVDLAA